MEIQERDRTWFCEEIQRCRTSLYRLALSITANPEDAAEAAAEAVCRAYEKFPQLRDRKKFQPWILKITRNEAYALCRHRSRMVPLEHLMEDAAVPEPGRHTMAGGRAAASGAAGGGGTVLLRGPSHRGDQPGHRSLAGGGADSAEPGPGEASEDAGGESW